MTRTEALREMYDNLGDFRRGRDLDETVSGLLGLRRVDFKPDWLGTLSIIRAILVDNTVYRVPEEHPSYEPMMRVLAGFGTAEEDEAMTDEEVESSVAHWESPERANDPV